MKRLFRDRWDKKVAGVCGGLGQFLKIDPTIIRLLVVMICIFTAVLPVLILYIVAWMLIPLGPPTYIEFECKKLYRSVQDRKISGICGGIAESLGIDPTIVRIVVLFALLITGVVPILVGYIVGTLIIPEKPNDVK
ncbi:MAG: PspC domain-containing protein [Simkania sp.]|nr:PspC domain-containing protein [Simkania sp.]MCB1074205.1 PspC domain-containing protein [Simkania sp.]